MTETKTVQAEAPALHWRLTRLDADPCPPDREGYGPRAGRYALELLADAPTGQAILAACRVAFAAAQGPLVALQQELARTESAVKRDRLTAGLDQAHGELAAVEKTAKEALAAARQALADGKAPDKHEAAALKAQQRQSVLRNRIVGLTSALTGVQLLVADEQRAAVLARKIELRRAAIERQRHAEADLLAALAERLPGVLAAHAAVRAIVLDADDMAAMEADQRHGRPAAAIV